jgi:hypothetical protein
MTEYCAQMKFKQKIDEKIKSAEFFKFFFKMESQQIFFFLGKWEKSKLSRSAHFGFYVSGKKFVKWIIFLKNGFFPDNCFFGKFFKVFV